MDVKLTAQTGRPQGTRACRRLRREGKIPGVVYGLGEAPVPVAVEWTELRKALMTEAGLNALITLDVDGASSLTIIKELQRDPLKRAVTHVDFIRIDPDAYIEVEVPVTLSGEAVSLTQEGGIVEHLLHHLRIKAKPGRIPNELVADISGLTAETPIKVGDLALPEGVTTEVDLDDPVATGFIPRAAAEAEAPGAGEGEEGPGAEGVAETSSEAVSEGAEVASEGGEG